MPNFSLFRKLHSLLHTPLGSYTCKGKSLSNPSKTGLPPGGIDRLIDFVKAKAKPPRELTNETRLLRAEKCPKKPTP